MQKRERDDIARYFKLARHIHPAMIAQMELSNDMFVAYDVEIINRNISLVDMELIFSFGDGGRGFDVLSDGDDKYLSIRHYEHTVVFKDKKEREGLNLIHAIFAFLLISQLLLYLKLQNSLKPLGKIHHKLRKLEVGDLSSLDEKSEYKEIMQIIDSYNAAVGRLEYILETREMFNKVFMHEMKMPLAKGMFYLKQEPSVATNQKLSQILKGLNSQLDEFSKLESSILYNNEKEDCENNISEILDGALQRVSFGDNDIIDISGEENSRMTGDIELWIICFKNLIENGIKYSDDKKIVITYDDNSISFKNSGDPLPIDLSSNLKRWKLEDNQRHKSSSGFGFGLFIIKTIVTICNYELKYNYDSDKRELELRIYKDL